VPELECLVSGRTSSHGEFDDLVDRGPPPKKYRTEVVAGAILSRRQISTTETTAATRGPGPTFKIMAGTWKFFPLRRAVRAPWYVTNSVPYESIPVPRSAWCSPCKTPVARTAVWPPHCPPRSGAVGFHAREGQAPSGPTILDRRGPPPTYWESTEAVPPLRNRPRPPANMVG
jgi:hypothetical protein